MPELKAIVTDFNDLTAPPQRIGLCSNGWLFSDDAYDGDSAASYGRMRAVCEAQPAGRTLLTHIDFAAHEVLGGDAAYVGANILGKVDCMTRAGVPLLMHVTNPYETPHAFLGTLMEMTETMCKGIPPRKLAGAVPGGKG